MQTVRHPGPPAPNRIDVCESSGRKLSVVLAPGVTLEEAVAQALAEAGVDSAWLEVRDAPVTELEYVIPADSADDQHIAWYSSTYVFERPGHIHQLGMIVGRNGHASFLHGHGTWCQEDGAPALGHILAPQTKLAEPTPARGIALSGARFDRQDDVETNFTLFRPVQTGPADDGFAAVRIAPNEDFTTALGDACKSLGWSSARAYGLGSLFGARFTDGSVLPTQPTEFLLTDAEIGQGALPPELVIVGKDGEAIFKGRLSPGENPVLVTAEIVLAKVS